MLPRTGATVGRIRGSTARVSAEGCRPHFPPPEDAASVHGRFRPTTEVRPCPNHRYPLPGMLVRMSSNETHGRRQRLCPTPRQELPAGQHCHHLQTITGWWFLQQPACFQLPQPPHRSMSWNQPAARSRTVTQPHTLSGAHECASPRRSARYPSQAAHGTSGTVAVVRQLDGPSACLEMPMPTRNQSHHGLKSRRDGAGCRQAS